MPVYFIQSGEGGPVKIGRAQDPKARLYELQVGNPEALCLLRVMDGGKPEEENLHEEFMHVHIRGEWFEYHPDMENYGTPFRRAFSETHCEPAASIVEKFGGIEATARLVGRHRSTVNRWLLPEGQGGGTGGAIHYQHQIKLLAAAPELGVDLKPEDFFPASVA